MSSGIEGRAASFRSASGPSSRISSSLFPSWATSGTDIAAEKKSTSSRFMTWSCAISNIRANRCGPLALRFNPTRAPLTRCRGLLTYADPNRYGFCRSDRSHSGLVLARSRSSPACASLSRSPDSDGRTCSTCIRQNRSSAGGRSSASRARSIARISFSEIPIFR
jgi:hypothetical protein